MNNNKNKNKNEHSFFKKIIFFIDRHILDLIFISFVFFVMVLIFALYELQIVQGEKHNNQVLAQTKNDSFLRTQQRGTIFFTNHQQERTAVALQGIAYTIAIVPKNIRNSELVYKKISKIIDLNKENFIKKAEKKNDPYEEIAHRISKEKKLEIQKLNISGVVFVQKSWRKYPFNEISGKILGFTNSKMVGIYGLEKYYEDILFREKDNSNKNIFWNFFRNKEDDTLFSKKVISKEGDLISSVDIGLSMHIERVLRGIDERYNSKYSAAIVIRPASGEIIAMTDSKTFNLNTERKDFRNRFVEHRFEVGSVFKPLVVAIGLESGRIKKDFTYDDDEGCVVVSGRSICNFDEKGRGKEIGLQKIVSQSLNTGMIEIVRKIGNKKFLQYMLDLGLAKETGIDIPGEISSTISNLNNGVDIDFAAASFGQGIAFTPIGITRALSSIANGGYLVEPNIIQKIEYDGLIPDREFTPKITRVFSPETVKIIKNIMVKRADTYAKNKPYFNRNYAIASKTGTAQIASSKGGYYTDRHIHAYFGFFPAYAKPEDRYAIFLYTVQPQNVRFSSQTMTEPFYEIVNFMIPYFRINPDRINRNI